MFQTPYQKMILDKMQSIYDEAENNGFYTEEMNKKLVILHNENQKCAHDEAYSIEHYTSGSASEL